MAARILPTTQEQIDDARRQLCKDVPGTAERLPDGRSYALHVVKFRSAEMRVTTKASRSDVAIQYQIVDNGNGIWSMEFSGWAPRDVVQTIRCVRGFHVVPIYRLLSLAELLIPAPPRRQETTIEVQKTFAGKMITYQWGWQRKSVRVLVGSVEIDLFYEANGSVYSFHSGKKYKSMQAAVDVIKGDPAMQSQVLSDMEFARKWDVKPVRRKRR